MKSCNVAWLMGLQYMIKLNEVYNPRICDIVNLNYSPVLFNNLFIPAKKEIREYSLENQSCTEGEKEREALKGESLKERFGKAHNQTASSTSFNVYYDLCYSM